MDLSETLLALVGAIAPDGGRGVGLVLRAALHKAAPFDAAEAVLRRPGGWVHSRLDEGDAAIVGDDLMARLLDLRAPLRIDEPSEAVSFPDTERRLEALGLRSLLAIPFAAGPPAGGRMLGGPEGAIVLARRFGWAFAGASLHYLWPVAGVAGRSFEIAIALTALTERNEILEIELNRLGSTPEARVAERSRLAQELEAALRERELVQERLTEALQGLDVERRTARDARSQLGAMLERLGEMESALAEARARADALRSEAERARSEADALRAQAAAEAHRTDAGSES